MVFNVHRNRTAYEGRGEGRERGYGGGGRGRLYTYRYTLTTRIKMGSDESHFNVSVGSEGQSHRTVSTNQNLFDKKGEPKRYRTEVLPLANLKPVLNWANVSSRT